MDQEITLTETEQRGLCVSYEVLGADVTELSAAGQVNYRPLHRWGLLEKMWVFYKGR